MKEYLEMMRHMELVYDDSNIIQVARIAAISKE